MDNEIAIKDLREFINAVYNEFFSKHPDIYRDVCHHLGGRIYEIKNGRLSEKKYIEKWGKHKLNV